MGSCGKANIRQFNLKLVRQLCHYHCQYDHYLHRDCGPCYRILSPFVIVIVVYCQAICFISVNEFVPGQLICNRDQGNEIARRRGEEIRE